MTPQEQLMAAANDLAQYGHAKEAFYEPLTVNGPERWRTSPACALGALARTMNLTEANGIIGHDEIEGLESAVAVRLLAANLKKRFPQLRVMSSPYSVITEYNDDESTSAEDVILAFKEAAHA